jgi:preprotein translocase subunit SecY
MTRLTFAGAIFLTIIAVLPSLLSQRLQVPQITAQFFGGTSLLIIVGVMLDTMRQVETHLIQRHYDGFLRKGRIRGRSFDASRSYNRGDAAGGGTLVWLYVGIAVLVIAGVAIFLVQK